MHRIFDVPELLSLIFASSQSADVLPLALVCRAWKHWALEIAWIKCGVPLPLLLALLAPVTTITESENIYHTFVPGNVTIEEIPPINRSGFLLRANKITSVTLDYGLHSSVITLLQSLIPTSNKLLPNLVSIRGGLKGDLCTTAALLIPTSTTLSSISLSMPSSTSSDYVESFFDTIHHTFTSIQHLSLRTGRDNWDALPCFSIFHSLRTLRFERGLSLYNDWNSLSRCSALEKVDFVDFVDEAVDVWKPTLDCRFSALKEFRIHSFRYAVDVSRALVYPSFPVLRVLEVVGGTLWREDLQRICMALAASSPSLEEVHFQCRGGLPLEAVRSLLELPHLRAVYLVGSGGGRQGDDALDDTAFESIARHMKRLQVLSLRSDCVTPRITPRSIQSLATYAKNLVELVIPVNALPFTLTSPPTSFALLDKLHLDIHLAPENVVAVAEYIAGICPTVRELEVKVQNGGGRQEFCDAFWRQNCSMKSK